MLNKNKKMSEKPLIYPEPTPLESSPHAIERLSKSIDQFVAYPDNAVISVPEMAVDQELRFTVDDIRAEVDWASEELSKHDSFEDFLVALSERVTALLPGNVEAWAEQFLGREEPATIAEVAEAGAANCFVRSVVFSGILQQVGIDAKAVKGHWVETTRQSVLGSYAVDADVKYRDKFRAGVTYLEGEKGESHIFSIIKYDGDYFIADPALWVKHEDGSLHYPLAKKTDREELLSRDIAFSLPDGQLRHYVFRNANPAEPLELSS